MTSTQHSSSTLPWTDRIRARLKHHEKGVPWWVNDKVKLYRFCSEHGIPMPRMHHVWRSPSELDLTDAPENVVLKPSVMHSAWGVMVLSRTEQPDVFTEALSGRTLTQEAIRSEQQRVYDRCKYKGSYRLFTEERVTGPDVHRPIPLDYKIYSFHGRIALVQQIDRNHDRSRIAWFDGNFAKLPLSGRVESTWEKVQLGEHVVPRDPRGMLEIAGRVTRELNTPFMRVDMFDAPGGPVVGELTPAPGGPYYRDWYSFTDDYDLTLGEEWSAAERRLDAATTS